MATETLSAKEVAIMAGTDGKTFRKFLRDHYAQTETATPGQGGRYAFTKGQANKLVKAYKAQVGTKPAAKAKAAPAAVEVEVIDDEEFVDLEDIEDPDFEDLDGEDEDADEVDEDDPDNEEYDDLVDLAE